MISLLFSGNKNGFFDFLRSFFTDSSSNSGLGNADNLHIKQQNNLVSNNIRNPILRSADDITEELIRRIIDNDLDSLTIDYEFTKAPPCIEEFDAFGYSRKNEYDWENWRTSQEYINPFYRAYRAYQKQCIQTRRRIEFKVILTRNVTSLAGAFADMYDLVFVNLTDTSMITNMSAMFCNDQAFNQDISGWDVSHVTDMRWMFFGAWAFNQPIGNWDVSHVTHMRGMFCRAYAFNQPIGNWDVSHVTDMSYIFGGAGDFNQPISDWDVSNVTNMSYIFGGARDFNQPIGNWDVSNVRNMHGMFCHAEAFNQPIGNWDVSHVDSMLCMFEDATAFNQPIGNWDVSNVRDRRWMFTGAMAFNQDISGWKKRPD